MPCLVSLYLYNVYMDIKKTESQVKKFDLEALKKATVGELLRSGRQKKGLKVYELAKLVKVNPVYITQIEKDYKLPSVETFIKIVKLLTFDLKTFLFLQDKFQDNKFPGHQKMVDLLADYIKVNYPDMYKKTIGSKP